MREILFKGKRKDDGDWIYGYYIKSRYYEDGTAHFGTTHFIVDMENEYDDYGGFSPQYEVDPETLCQHTGLTDKNGEKIFEGDIICAYDGKQELGTYYIKFEYGAYWNEKIGGNYICGCDTLPELIEECVVKVIGNMFENPELIRGVEE